MARNDHRGRENFNGCRETQRNTRLASSNYHETSLRLLRIRKFLSKIYTTLFQDLSKWGSECYGVDRRCGVAEVKGVVELLGSTELSGDPELEWRSGVEVGYGVEVEVRS